MAAPRLTTAARGSNVTDETRANFMRKFISANNDALTYRAIANNVLKQAKRAGLNIGSMKRAVSDKVRDLPDVITDEREYVRFMALLNMPIDQVELFPPGPEDDAAAAAGPEKSDEDREWEAGDAGYQAGLAGRKVEECPHLQGTLEHQAWHRGWHIGQEHAVKRAFESDGKPKQASGRRQRQASGTAPAPGLTPSTPEDVRATVAEDDADESEAATGDAEEPQFS